jgi:hypothetical protein
MKTRKNFYSLMSCVVMIILSAALCCAASAGDSLSARKSPGFQLAPEFHFNEDLHTFFLQKDANFRERYFVEWISGAELAFFSINDRFFFFGEMALTIGLGKWENKAILFDPREVDAGFGPLVEYRFAPVNISLGLDHHCFHEIDTLDMTPVYWNKLYLGAASPNFRPGPYRSALSDPAPLTWKNRLAWQATLGYYVHELFGMDTSIIAWNQDYAADIIAEARYAAFRWNGFTGIVSAKTGAYLTRTSGVKWKQEAGAEIMATQGRFGLSLFVNWVMLDQLQKRLNRDKLLVVGIKGFL